jgi:hypothetical protein
VGSRNSDVAQKQFEIKLKALTNENQMLKARAFDDLNRIKELETEISLKSKETAELYSFYEELLDKSEAQRK